jgi:hypothetical protein
VTAILVTPPIAHAGHWIAGLLYLAPVVIVVGALVFQSWKDRRAGDGDGAEEPTAGHAAHDPGDRFEP